MRNKAMSKDDEALVFLLELADSYMFKDVKYVYDEDNEASRKDYRNTMEDMDFVLSLIDKYF